MKMTNRDFIIKMLAHKEDEKLIEYLNLDDLCPPGHKACDFPDRTCQDCFIAWLNEVLIDD